MTMIGNIEKYLSYFFVTNIQNVNFMKIFPHISATRNIKYNKNINKSPKIAITVAKTIIEAIIKFR